MDTWGAVAFIAAGVLFLALGAGFYVSQRKKAAACTARTQAELLRYEERLSTNTNSDGHSSTSKTYAPVLRFMAGGEEHTVRHSISTGRRKWDVGEYVPISYDPLKPSAFLIDGDNTYRIFIAAFTAAGLLLIGAGIWWSGMSGFADRFSSIGM